jgi:EAL domain-containing protein (putative c-di-GMP-specific phosphodiesterase class I)
MDRRRAVADPRELLRASASTRALRRSTKHPCDALARKHPRSLRRARDVLARLNKLGVRLAIDDFGSGHSSLGYLRQLPISVLKIDRSFVQKMVEDSSDAALVRSAIDLGHNLGLEVVAEGVETEEAKRHLESLGCDTLQGYHLGRPQAASSLNAIGYARHRRRAAS